MIYEPKDRTFEQLQNEARTGEFTQVQLSYKAVLIIGQNPNTKKLYYRIDRPHASQHYNRGRGRRDIPDF